MEITVRCHMCPNTVRCSSEDYEEGPVYCSKECKHDDQMSGLYSYPEPIITNCTICGQEIWYRTNEKCPIYCSENCELDSARLN